MEKDRKINIYIFFLFAAASAAILYCFGSDSSIKVNELLPLLILAVFGEIYKIQVYPCGNDVNISISWSLVPVLGALMALGTKEAILVSVAASIACSLYPKRLSGIKLFYNLLAYALTAAITAIIASFVMPMFETSVSMLVAFTISMIYVLIDYTLCTVMIKILTEKDMVNVLTDMIFPHAPHSIMLSFIGSILGMTYMDYGFIALVFTMMIVFIIILSLRSTVKIASKKILELEESNAKADRLAADLDQTLDELIRTLTVTIDARDPYTYGHSVQVSYYAVLMALEMGIDKEEIEKIRIAGLLHDIGKISIKENILFKPDKLTNEEYEIVKTHASAGMQILSEVSKLAEIARLIGMHHERYDGRGYPKGLKCDETPIAAYILAVADSLDTILSDRAYKKGATIEEALAEFERCKDSQFHPEVVAALFRLYEKYGRDIFQNSAKLIDENIIKDKLGTSPRSIMCGK